MKYVLNKGRYAIAFEIVVNGKERKIEIDKRRIFRDTGNVATTGITAVEDDVYEVLLTNKRFKKLLESEELELTEESKIETSEKVNESLKAENEQLKKELEEAKKGNSNKKAKEELKEKEEEIASLKSQLEALTKDKKAETDTDGF